MTPDDRPAVRYLALAAALLISSVVAITRPPFAPSDEWFPRSSDAAEASVILDEQLHDRLTWISVPGAAVAVVRNGQLIELQAGVARAWSDMPVRADTQFEAASLSKPLTAYAIMRLARLGALDLDAPLTRAGHTFTIRQVLSHTAGFDNDLTASLEPRTSAGEFDYAGAGYLFLGEIIEQTTGQGFAEHMNSVVLPGLGMTHSQFGARDEAPLALPSIDTGLPFAVMITVAALVAAPLLFGHALAARLWRSRRNRTWRITRHFVVIFAIGCSAFALRWIFGGSNWITLVLTSSSLLALGSVAWLLVTHEKVAVRAVGAVCATLFVALLAMRPPAPLAERGARFLPAAGLRTTASDYAHFLVYILEEAEREAFWAQMFAPHAHANTENDWGLGLGLQNGETPTAWHWGVNYPGYQALAIANRETGDVAVILMNGGQISFSPSGFRYSGLETARSAIARIEGGRHGAYWQGIQ